MYDQPLPQTILFYILYGAVTMATVIASCYLLFSRGNAFMPDKMPPRRLRRWTAALIASTGLANMWYLPVAFATSHDKIMLGLYIGALLDFMICFPLAIIVMLVILQDRRRPLWPAPLLMLPPSLTLLWCMVKGIEELLPAIFVYMALLGIGLTIYMARALRQYDRWLRDNYADLEHKEVWQSFLVMASLLLLLAYFLFGAGSSVYEYILQIAGLAICAFLLWRVETLEDLQTLPRPEDFVRLRTKLPVTEGSGHTQGSELSTPLPHREGPGESLEGPGESLYIDRLLTEHCVTPQLYLQHDLSLQQLSQAVGTNRFYLSQYFSRKGVTYNTYINNLRINHFMNLYQDAVAAGESVSAQQLSLKSGFRSYSTFGRAFMQRTGQSVTAWMRDPKVSQ